MENVDKLGCMVKDKISGFEGIAVSKHIYLTGCERITVQPKIDKDGKLPQPETFDSPQLEIIFVNKFINSNNKIGGAEKYSDIRHY